MLGAALKEVETDLKQAIPSGRKPGCGHRRTRTSRPATIKLTKDTMNLALVMIVIVVIR
jgi:hypothetical protein